MSKYTAKEIDDDKYETMKEARQIFRQKEGLEELLVQLSAQVREIQLKVDSLWEESQTKD
jgi:hypothetical protein